ncbi:hypothetical protein SO802_006611 [Lithocarpus litseifolius]|uniref:Uncharacterized protein n=1 Tax=Lithocarpus litseifolius TaxID=425828 RepID=A0AAW2DPG9_9ROSI
MVNYELGSEIYTNFINALQAVEELGRLTLDDAHATGIATEPAVGCGRQVGGRQGQGGCRQSIQRPTSVRRPTSAQRPTFGRRHTLVHDHTMEETSQTEDEMCLDIGYDMGSMAHDDAGPSHTFAHGDTSRSPSTSSTTTPLPTTRMSPPPTTSTAPADVRGRDDMRFMPTPGAVPLPTPPPEASHIENRPRRLQRTQTYPLDCGTGHGETSQGTSEEKKTGMNFDGSKKANKKGAPVTTLSEDNRLAGLIYVNEQFDGWKDWCLRILKNRTAKLCTREKFRTVFTLASIDVLVQYSQGTAAGGTMEIVVNGTKGLLHPAAKEGASNSCSNSGKLNECSNEVRDRTVELCNREKKIQDRVHFVNKTLTVAPFLASIDVLVQNSQTLASILDCCKYCTVTAFSLVLLSIIRDTNTT